MKMITAELMRQLKSAAQEEIMCREASDTSDAWQDLASPENILALVEIALPLLDQQSGWQLVPTSLTDEMIRGIVPTMARSKPISHDEYDHKGRNEHFIKWIWSRMLDLSPKPQPHIIPHIDNDGREG
ncbi:hypothetical protein [Erwinia sp. V71]|uniref:hypothetical protein n=1 Tax=Erwinia sp. V71 TaxID=3369424 RepID=UPI003F6335C5